MSALALFRHHLRMLTRPVRLVFISLLAALPALIMLSVGITGDISATDVTGMLAGVGATTFPIAALLLASATLRDERDDGTLPYLYLTPVSRPVMAGTSIAAGAVVSSLVGLIAALAALGAGAIVGIPIEFGLAAIPTYVVAAVGYAPLFVPAGYLVPRVVLVGLAYVILWEQIVARLVTGVANTSVWRFALSVYADLVPSGNDVLAEALGPVAPGTGGALGKVAVVALLGWLLLVWALRNRDAV